MAEQSVCSFGGCDKAVKSKGYCRLHYVRFSKYGDPSFTKKPRGKVREPNQSCSRCDTQNPRTREHFSPSSNTKDGLHSACNACLADARRDRRAETQWKREEAVAKAAAPFKACGIDGCSNNAHWRLKGVRGWCSAHYATKPEA